MVFWVLTSLLLAALAVWVWKSRSREQAPARLPPRAEKNKYHAVTIAYRASACEAAKLLSQKRFLSADAPTLPLLDCDSKVCQCRYVHFDDRRSGEDRRDSFGPGNSSGSEKSDRRHVGPDRRRSHLFADDEEF